LVEVCCHDMILTLFVGIILESVVELARNYPRSAWLVASSLVARLVPCVPSLCRSYHPPIPVRTGLRFARWLSTVVAETLTFDDDLDHWLRDLGSCLYSYHSSILPSPCSTDVRNPSSDRQPHLLRIRNLSLGISSCSPTFSRRKPGSFFCPRPSRPGSAIC
jgi:hypothetical protein